MSYEINFAENEEYIGIYGVEFNGTNPGKRLYDSRYLKFRKFKPSNTTTAGYDTFIKTNDSPFAIKEVATKYNASSGKQEVLAYEGDSNWNSAISDPEHNRMIEFPKFYYNRPSQYRWEVSTTQHPGFKPSPMHYRNGVMHDKVWVSKYHLNTNFLSQTGQVIATYNGTYTETGSDTTDYTIGRFRNNLRTKGMYVLDYATVCSINMLMFIKYASLNVQSLIGFGWCGQYTNGAKTNTGGADNVKGKDGYSGTNKTDNASIVCFGIENWYSNVWKFIDGLVRVGTTMYINTNIENITSNPSTSNMGGYVACGSACPSNVGSDYFGWINNSIAYDSVYDWAMYPTNVANATGEYHKSDPGYLIGDGYWYDYLNKFTIYETVFGGSWGFGFTCGPLCLSLLYPMAYAHMFLGSGCISIP